MKKIIFVIFIIVAGYAVASFLFGFIKSGRDHSYIVAGKAPLIIAHGSSNQLFPENTMLAFDGVVQFHPDVMEMDVVLTSDSVLITHHDPTINRLSNGAGKVVDYTYAEVSKFNFAHNFQDVAGNYVYRDSLVPPAVLEDVLAKYGRDYLFCIELKDYPTGIGQRAARELLRLLQKYNMEERTMVACFDDDILAYFRKISRGKTYMSSGKALTKRFVVMNICFAGNFFTHKCDALQIPVESDGFHLDGKRLIRTAHRKNMAVHYWTINDPIEMKRLMELGADGIITDRPDLADKVLREMGLRK